MKAAAVMFRRTLLLRTSQQEMESSLMELKLLTVVRNSPSHGIFSWWPLASAAAVIKRRSKESERQAVNYSSIVSFLVFSSSLKDATLGRRRQRKRERRQELKQGPKARHAIPKEESQRTCLALTKDLVIKRTSLRSYVGLLKRRKKGPHSWSQCSLEREWK